MNNLKKLSDFIDTVNIPIETSHIMEYPVTDYLSLRYHLSDKKFYIYQINLESGEEEYFLFDVEKFKDNNKIQINKNTFLTSEEFDNFKTFIEENNNYFNNM
jgi:hypothetical protein